MLKKFAQPQIKWIIPLAAKLHNRKRNWPSKTIKTWRVTEKLTKQRKICAFLLRSLHPNQRSKKFTIELKNYFLSFVLVVSFGVSDFLTGGNLRLVEAARLGLIVLVLLRLFAVATEFFVFASSLPSTMAGFTDSLGVAVANPATAKVSL